MVQGSCGDGMDSGSQVNLPMILSMVQVQASEVRVGLKKVSFQKVFSEVLSLKVD